MTRRTPPKRTTSEPAPAPTDLEELRGTIDLMATVVASVSDRVDTQSQILDQVHKTTVEARLAAFAAQNQTDPENYGALIAETVDGDLRKSVQLTCEAGQEVMKAARLMKATAQDAENKTETILQTIQNREEQIGKIKHRQPWLITGAVLLGIALALTLPRFLASTPTTCAVIGGTWQTTSTGGHVCVFYTN